MRGRTKRRFGTGERHPGNDQSGVGQSTPARDHCISIPARSVHTRAASRQNGLMKSSRGLRLGTELFVDLLDVDLEK
jgi:hypothetical protein